MILPASYLNGFAPRDGQPLYPSLWKGCCGAWNPGLGPSGLTLRDQSGFGRHGTLTNGPTWEANQGQYAMSFDGVDDTVIQSGTTTYASSGLKFSVSAWAYLTSFSGVPYPKLLMLKSDDTNAWELGFSDQVNYLGVLIGTAGTWARCKSDTTAATITYGWRNVAVSYNGAGSGTLANFQVYLDGVLLTMTSASSFSATTNVTSIALNANNNRWLGFIDDVRIYNRALSPDEIRTLATRRGIAYEMAPRRRSQAQVTVAPLRYNLFSGSIGNTDVIGAS